jgi:hypothetical protein
MKPPLATLRQTAREPDLGRDLRLGTTDLGTGNYLATAH